MRSNRIRSKAEMGRIFYNLLPLAQSGNLTLTTLKQHIDDFTPAEIINLQSMTEKERTLLYHLAGNKAVNENECIKCCRYLVRKGMDPRFKPPGSNSIAHPDPIGHARHNNKQRRIDAMQAALAERERQEEINQEQEQRIVARTVRQVHQAPAPVGLTVFCLGLILTSYSTLKNSPSSFIAGSACILIGCYMVANRVDLALNSDREAYRSMIEKVSQGLRREIHEAGEVASVIKDKVSNWKLI